jgi:hypothetical protein
MHHPPDSGAAGSTSSLETTSRLPECRKVGVVVEHPFGEAFELLVAQVAGAVEPCSRRRGHTNSVVALDPVDGTEDTGATQEHPASEWRTIVRYERNRLFGAPHMAEIPELRCGDAGDDDLGICRACSSAPRLEGVG